MQTHPMAPTTMSSSQNPLLRTLLRFVAIAFAFVLLAALWSTALARLSDRATATDLLTRAGTDLINPLLLANGSGLAQGAYQQIEQTAQSHPNQPVQIAFLKVQIPGQELTGKSFSAGSQVIYAHVADAYYSGGPGAAFALPPQLQSLVSTYTPFVTSSSTAITNATKSTLPALPLPQLPAFASQIYTTVGITPTTLTASGHQNALDRSRWLWSIGAVLALVLILLSTGWSRLTSVAWPLFHASWHIALIGAIATILIVRNPTQAAPFRGVLDIVGGTFMTVFYAAALIGIVAVAVSYVGRRLPALASRPQADERTGQASARPYYQSPQAQGPGTPYNQGPSTPYNPGPSTPYNPGPSAPYNPGPSAPYNPGQGAPYNQGQGAPYNRSDTQPMQFSGEGADEYPPRQPY